MAGAILLRFEANWTSKGIQSPSNASILELTFGSIFKLCPQFFSTDIIPTAMASLHMGRKEFKINPFNRVVLYDANVGYLEPYAAAIQKSLSSPLSAFGVQMITLNVAAPDRKKEAPLCFIEKLPSATGRRTRSNSYFKVIYRSQYEFTLFITDLARIQELQQKNGWQFSMRLLYMQRENKQDVIKYEKTITTIAQPHCVFLPGFPLIPLGIHEKNLHDNTLRHLGTLLPTTTPPTTQPPVSITTITTPATSAVTWATLLEKYAKGLIQSSDFEALSVYCSKDDEALFSNNGKTEPVTLMFFSYVIQLTQYMKSFGNTCTFWLLLFRCGRYLKETDLHLAFLRFCWSCFFLITKHRASSSSSSSSSSSPLNFSADLALSVSLLVTKNTLTARLSDFWANRVRLPSSTFSSSSASSSSSSSSLSSSLSSAIPLYTSAGFQAAPKRLELDRVHCPTCHAVVNLSSWHLVSKLHLKAMHVPSCSHYHSPTALTLLDASN